MPTSNPQQYQQENRCGHLLVCHHHNQHNRICLSNKMLPLIVDWYHKATAHNMGITRLQENLRFIVSCTTPGRSLQAGFRLQSLSKDETGIASVQIIISS